MPEPQIIGVEKNWCAGCTGCGFCRWCPGKVQAAWIATFVGFVGLRQVIALGAAEKAAPKIRKGG